MCQKQFLPKNSPQTSQVSTIRMKNIYIRMIIFNITNISYHLLFSNKKVDPSKNVALS